MKPRYERTAIRNNGTFTCNVEKKPNFSLDLRQSNICKAFYLFMRLVHSGIVRPDSQLISGEEIFFLSPVFSLVCQTLKFSYTFINTFIKDKLCGKNILLGRMVTN